MAKTLEDLETFWRGVFQMKPWEYDHSVSILITLFSLGTYHRRFSTFRGGR